MRDNKSLQDKQIIRAIADLIVQEPTRVIELFGNMDDIVSVYPELEGVRNVVIHFPAENYAQMLESEIGKIDDKDTKSIFISALDSINLNKRSRIAY